MPISPDETIELSPDVTLEWFFGHTIVAYTPRSASRRATDIMVDKALEIVRSQKADQPYFAMYDASNILTLTPYARKRVQEITTTLGELNKKGATTVVLGNSVVSNIIRLYVERDLRRTRTNINRSVQQDRQKALQWLYEELKAHQQQDSSS